MLRNGRRFHLGNGKGWKWVMELHGLAAIPAGNPWNAASPFILPARRIPRRSSPAGRGTAAFPGHLELERTREEQRRPR